MQMLLEGQSIIQVEAGTEEMARPVVQLGQWPMKHEPLPNRDLEADTLQGRDVKRLVSRLREVALLNRNPEEMREEVTLEGVWHREEGL